MRLTKENLKEQSFWEEKGYTLPGYDIEKIAENTKQRPSWLHFGAGNIFRAFPAVLQQQLIRRGLADTGIIVSEAFDEEILDKAYRAYDNLSVAVTLASSGDIRKEIVASIAESVKPLSEYERMEEIFRADSLQMVSFTITEKGYALRNAEGKLLPWIKKDLDRSAGERPESTIALLTAFCYTRYQHSAAPLALVSMDNCSHNGTLLKEAVMLFAEKWIENGLYEAGFADYLRDPKKISFNWSMIDKITPRPADAVIESLEADGLEQMRLTKTGKNTYVAPFVNAEESQYLAIEEHFPNGRPALEEVGVLFADKEVIDKIEKMKVCTCLNPLHTVLAVFGCLLDYTSISQEMKNSDLKAFIEAVGYKEGMPVVVDPGIIKAEDFIKETIERRFPNPFVPDTPQRIATDTSKKIPVRFGETLKAYIAQGKKDLSFLNYIPLFFAAYLRYLMGINDKGASFEQSPDPNLEELKALVSGIKLGDRIESRELKDILSREDIFGVDLYAHGLGEKVEQYFNAMNAGPGAVAAAIARISANEA